MAPAAQALRQQLGTRLISRIEQQSLSGQQLKALLRRIADIDRSVRAADFLVAEQAAMASQVLSDALIQRGEPSSRERRAAIDALFRSVRRRETFEPKLYQTALQQLQQSLR